MCSVSVIVPVFNAEETLSRCLDSILSQSFTDFELLLVDDGSVDGSLALCELYSKKDPRIIVYHKTNEGVSFTRNYGLDKAKGKYVCFADSDDYVSSEWLLQLVSTIEAHPNSFVLSNVMIIEPEGSYLRYQSLEGECNLSEIWRAEGWGYSVNKIYRRDIIEKNHIRYDTALRVYEDELFVARYAAYTEKAFVIPEVGYYYQLSNQFENKYLQDLNFEYMTYQYKELKKFNKYCSDFTVDRLTMIAYRRIMDDRSSFSDTVLALRNIVGPDIRFVKGGKKVLLRKLSGINCLCVWKTVFRLYTTLNLI